MALESDGEDLALPGLHIAEIVAEKAAAEGYRRVGVLGTKYTMAGPICPRVLAAKGIAAEIPDSDERRLIDDIIFTELREGVFTTASRQCYLDIISRLHGLGCAAIALVCTEILLFGDAGGIFVAHAGFHAPARGSRPPGRHRGTSASDLAWRRYRLRPTSHTPRAAAGFWRHR